MRTRVTGVRWEQGWVTYTTIAKLITLILESFCAQGVRISPFEILQLASNQTA